MHDSKSVLEQARRRAPDTPFDMEDVRARRNRRQRRRKAGATVLGLGLTAALFSGVVAAVVSSDTKGDERATKGGSAPLSPTEGVIPSLEPGDFSYQRIRIDSPCEGCGSSLLLLESWWALDDSGRIEVLEKTNYGVDAGTFGPGAFPSEGDLSAYPTQPAALEAFLLDRSGPDGASPRPDVTPAPDVSLDQGLLWLAIQDYLGSTQYLNTTPALRAAMLEVLAGIPMVTIEEGSTDPLGRPATVLRFHAYDADNEVFVDPSSGDFLAMTERYDESVRSVVMESAGVTSDDHSRPEGSQRTVPQAS